MEAKAAVAFERRVPHSMPLEEALAALSAQGFTRILTQKETPDAVTLTVAADRFRPSTVERARAMEALETALEKGAGEVIFGLKKKDPGRLLDAGVADASARNAVKNSMPPALRISVSIPPSGPVPFAADSAE